MLEHFGFLEFLNLTHSAAHDSIQAEKKEIFDNFADIAMRNKKEFRDDQDNQNQAEEDTQQQAKPEDVGVQIQQARLTQKSGQEIRDSYLTSSSDELTRRKSQLLPWMQNKSESDENGAGGEEDKSITSIMMVQQQHSNTARETNAKITTLPLFPLREAQPEDFEEYESPATIKIGGVPVQLSRETQTYQYKPNEKKLKRFRYWILPALNQDLMAEFERDSYCEEASHDRGENNHRQQNGGNAVARFNNPNIPQNRRDERTFVHLCWIYMWCGSLWQQDKKEQLFRTNQLL